jgi:hypothetical protein
VVPMSMPTVMPSPELTCGQAFAGRCRSIR